MFNYRVDDLDRMLAELRALGDQAEAQSDDSEFGRFGRIIDPDGHKLELWQPAPESTA